MEMITQSWKSIHGDALGGGSECIRGEGTIRRSLQSLDIQSGSFRPRSGQVGGACCHSLSLSEMEYSNERGEKS
jgi:hypothetical protein